MIEVYHRKQPTFMMYDTDAIAEHRQTWAAGGCELVAYVVKPLGEKRTDEEYAFRVTNSIDSYWGDNEGVTPGPKAGTYRSTSVGDVVKKSDGTLLICAPCGWEKL
jgi:hypothetical protein